MSLISPNGLDSKGRLKSGWASASVQGGHVSLEQMAAMSREDRRAMIQSFSNSVEGSDKHGRVDRTGTGQKEWQYPANMFNSMSVTGSKLAKKFGKKNKTTSSSSDGVSSGSAGQGTSAAAALPELDSRSAQYDADEATLSDKHGDAGSVVTDTSEKTLRP